MVPKAILSFEIGQKSPSGVELTPPEAEEEGGPVGGEAREIEVQGYEGEVEDQIDFRRFVR